MVNNMQLIRYLREEGSLALKDNLPAPLREAELFRYILNRLPIGLIPNETLAGEYGVQYLDEESRNNLLNAIERSFGNEGIKPFAELYVRSDLEKQMSAEFICYFDYTAAHTTLDYQKAIESGIDGILKEVSVEKDQAEGERKIYLDAVEIALHTILNWVEKLSNMALELAKDSKHSDFRQNLLQMGNMLKRVPKYPAESFHEAVQSVWLLHLLVGISEYSGASLSLGRADQYLYPYYLKDLKTGVDKEDIEKTIEDLWKKLNCPEYSDPACALNLGGVDLEGKDLFNPLSEMFVAASRHMKLPSPILAARIHKNMEQRVFDLLVDPELSVMGQPTYYGEFACRRALKERGIPETELWRFSVNSCMGLIMPGEEISDMWGGVVNLLLPLELSMNVGKPFLHKIPMAFATVPQTEYTSFEKFFKQYRSYLKEIVDFVVKGNRKCTESIAKNLPNPFLSAFITDCIKKGMDRAAGGARYHSVIIEGAGFANVSDALTAIKKLVFDERKYILQEMLRASQNNFNGYEDIYGEILKCPKYGNGNMEADSIASAVTAVFAEIVSVYTHDNLYYLPSYHSLDANVGWGQKIGASLDGRHAGEPLNKNAGAGMGKNKEGHTALFLSASSIGQSQLSGGQPVDIYIDKSMLSELEGKRKFQALLQTYFELGGLQIQVNAVSIENLKQALENPADHQDILVRIGGYSARFVNLDRRTQEEMMHRFERDM